MVSRCLRLMSRLIYEPALRKRYLSAHLVPLAGAPLVAVPNGRNDGPLIDLAYLGDRELVMHL